MTRPVDGDRDLALIDDTVQIISPELLDGGPNFLSGPFFKADTRM